MLWSGVFSFRKTSNITQSPFFSKLVVCKITAETSELEIAAYAKNSLLAFHHMLLWGSLPFLKGKMVLVFSMDHCNSLFPIFLGLSHNALLISDQISAVMIIFLAHTVLLQAANSNCTYTKYQTNLFKNTHTAGRMYRALGLYFDWNSSYPLST